MRLLLMRGLRRRHGSNSSSHTPEQTWEKTRSCPGSLRCHRREPAPQPPVASSGLGKSLQRHNSDPGSIKSRSPSPAAVAFYKRQRTVESLGGSVAIDMHTIHDSRWSLYKPSAHWDEVFEPGRDSHLHQDPADEQDFNLKHLLNTGRPRSRLRCLAIVFAIVYLAYAFYVTISRVNRTCKPHPTIAPKTTAPPTLVTNVVDAG